MPPGERIELWLRSAGAIVACVLISAQLLTSLIYLVGRRLLHFSTTPLAELEWHFFFALVFLSLGGALLADRHVRIDIIRERISARSRTVIEIVGYFVALRPFCLALVWFGVNFAWDAFQSGEGSRAALGLPYRWIIKSTVPIGGFILLVCGTILAARNISSLRRNTTGRTGQE